MAKVALVTGASRGIGRATAEAFARAGYQVAANYCRSKEQIEQFSAQMEREGCAVIPVQADVSDPEQVEAAGVTEINGLGLLEMDTEFRGEKVQTQTQGVFRGVEGMLSGLNGLAYEGYEIHMGRSQQQMPALTGSRNVYGSYVHGIFDAPGITDTILKALCARKGVSFDALATFDARGYKERQYDLLADVVRGGLDMSFVYRVLRREV